VSIAASSESAYSYGQDADVWGSGVGDLLSTLDGGTMTRRITDLGRSASAGSFGSLPKNEDNFRPKFRPPPSREEVKQLLLNDTSRGYRSCGRIQGELFGETQRIRPKILSPRTIARLNVPDRTYAKSRSQIAYHAQPEVMPELGDDSCTEMHRDWLKSHRTRRDREMHAEFHALNRIDKATAAVDDIAKMKAIARDIISRDHAWKPSMSSGAKSSLQKVKKAVSTARQFNKIAGIDVLQMEEERMKDEVRRAKAAKCLSVRPAVPQGRVTHAQGWGGPDRNIRYLRESTPWRQQDDARSLAATGGPGRARRPSSVA